MKHACRNPHRGVGVGRLAVLGAMLGCGVSLTQAQEVVIRNRPLTPQEIKDYGLATATQKSSGSANVGLGQPVYMEALVEEGTVVNAVNWTLVGKPAGSTATIQPGPLDLSIPTYDGGDRIGLFVAGRAVLKPDALSTFDFDDGTIADYRIRTDVVTPSGTLSFTNSAYGSQYLGREHYLCVLCHADKQEGFETTLHAIALTEQITGAGSDHFNANCISCHTLGYDATPGAVNGGFDDVAAQIGWTFPATLTETNWTQMDPLLQVKSNVQCESCHGPAYTHMTSLGQTEAIDVSLSAGTCGQCHDSLSHHVKPFEWGQSLHATGYVFRFSGSCIPCHSTKGFIDTWDPVYADNDLVPRGTAEEGIACAACHDPHTDGMGEHQLRNIQTATLGNGSVVTEDIAGDGVLCMNCHHSRSDAATAIAGAASNRFGPHNGPQGDMLMGTNGYHYGMAMPSSRHMTAVEGSCVGCHMQTVADTEFAAGNTKVGGHTFRLTWDGDTPENPLDDVQVTAVCSACHVESGTFDFGGEDYDRDGKLEGVQSEIAGLLDQLGRLLPPIGSPEVETDESYDTQQKQAAWNYRFVGADKSHGVHNPKYAAALLRAAIDDLTGGIDVDQDGLIDSWELAYFGDLTLHTGQGDADGDGVLNGAELQAGSDPTKLDTDGDGYADLAELQGGSDPLDFASVLPANTLIQMLPAMELGYVPDAPGATKVFQSLDMLGSGGSWTDVGEPFVSGEGIEYQLISLRDSTQKVFRVIGP
jgi:mono/diheme cytochrome c family protein